MSILLASQMKRRCKSCGDYKDTKEFYRLTSSEDGWHPNCKLCCKVSRALEAVRRRDKKSKISVRQYYRAINLNIPADKTITLAEVFKRSRGTCSLCHTWVQPRKASIDHTHPLSLGGHHSWDNVQLVHIRCNLKKGARV